jgi:hypothetical protein
MWQTQIGNSYFFSILPFENLNVNNLEKKMVIKITGITAVARLK